MRGLRAHLSYANVMSSIAVFMVLGGSAYAAATLPRNSVGSTQLKSNAVTSSKVKNGSLQSADFGPGQMPTGATGATGAQGPSGPAGPAGSPGAKGDTGAKGDKGDACLSSDPACRGPKGDAGQNGQDGAPGPSAQRLDVSVDNGSSSDVAVVGNFTLRFVCSGDAAHRLFTLGVPGGSGGIQLSGIKTISDTSGSTVPFAAGAGIPAGQFVGIGVGQPNPNNTSGFFYRMNGTFVLHNGLTVTTVVYDMFLENRSNQGTCLFRGTAVPSGLVA